MNDSILMAGDLVRILKRSYWGGITETFDEERMRGILIKKVYSAYQASDDEWEVLISGKPKRIRGKNLVKLKG